MGVEVERLKRLSIILVSAMTGAAVAFSGVIGFVGIVVPHLLRLITGPGHRRLLPASACVGAILLLAADTFARTIGSAGRSANRRTDRACRRTNLSWHFAPAALFGWPMTVTLETLSAGVRVGAKALLDDVSLMISAGEAVVLVGPNGCRKINAAAHAVRRNYADERHRQDQRQDPARLWPTRPGAASRGVVAAGDSSISVSSG